MTLPLVSPFTDGTFVNKAQLDALVDSINAVNSNSSYSGWTVITLASGYSAVTGYAPSVATVGLVAYFRGQVQKTSGSFAASTDVAVAAAGALSIVGNGKFRQLASSTADVSGRGALLSDGSIHVLTGAVVGAFYDLSGLSGILTGS